MRGSPAQTNADRAHPGERIRYWRSARGLSQMALALDVSVSPRHMSFIETGRSRPSRELVVRLARRLAIPAREENALLESAGYARRHRESTWDSVDIQPAKEWQKLVTLYRELAAGHAPEKCAELAPRNTAADS